MNCVKCVEVKSFHLCSEVTPQCAEKNALPVYEPGSIFDSRRVKIFRPSDAMKE
jgi:hypothetical protein